MTIFLAALLMNIFAYLTIRLRPLIYNVKVFRPMLWNFKLSLLPFLIIILTGTVVIFLLALSANLNWLWLRWFALLVLFVGMLVWMAMLPNSGYLITELNLTHRSQDSHEVPIWYDIISVLSFALSGVINTLTNIVLVQLIIVVVMDPTSITRTEKITFVITAFIINTLVAIGVYMGRSIRFNSWDLLHPKSFINKFIEHFKEPGNFKDACLFVFFHAAFFMLMYLSFGLYNIIGS